MSRYQKGKTNVDFNEARDSEWQWHQLGHMQVCTSLQRDNHDSTPSLSFFTGRMPFLPPNQLHQSTEGLLQSVQNPNARLQNNGPQNRPVATMCKLQSSQFIAVTADLRAVMALKAGANDKQVCKSGTAANHKQTAARCSADTPWTIKKQYQCTAQAHTGLV